MKKLFRVNFRIKALFFLFVFILFFTKVSAADVCKGDPKECLNALDPTIAAGGSFFQLIDEVMNRLPYFLGGLAFLALLYSGAIYIGALGDPTKMEAAKKNLTWTAIGILASASVFIVIKLILWITNPTSL